MTTINDITAESKVYQALREADSTTITTKQLRRVVALVLAQHAQKRRRRDRKYSYSTRNYDRELTLQKIRWAVEDLLTPNGEDGKRDSTKWYAIHQNLTDTRYRNALKHWEAQSKVISRRHGQAGNGYRWVLLCESNELARDKRRRKIREARREAEKAERDTRTAKTQVVADRLTVALSLPQGTIKAWDNNITISKELAEAILLGWIGE